MWSVCHAVLESMSPVLSPPRGGFASCPSSQLNGNSVLCTGSSHISSVVRASLILLRSGHRRPASQVPTEACLMDGMIWYESGHVILASMDRIRLLSLLIFFLKQDNGDTELSTSYRTWEEVVGAEEWGTPSSLAEFQLGSSEIRSPRKGTGCMHTEFSSPPMSF